jgi:dsRNA-specific ribonuclease
LAGKAQARTLSLQQYLHLLPYQPDLYTPTGHLPAAAGGAAPAAAVSSKSSSGSKIGPIGLFQRQQKGSADPPIELQRKQLTDGLKALIGAAYLSAAAEAGLLSGAAGRTGAGSAAPVFEPGLAAAAVVCQVTGVLPAGAAELACKPCLDAFAIGSRPKQVLGHTFTHPELLQCAVTHVSQPSSGNYQRLEYLGDSVLDLYVSSWLLLQLGQALQQEGSR